MLNLQKGAKDFERFHLQAGLPVARVASFLGIVKRVTWSNLFLPDGSPGYFHSWWIIGNAVHWYKGNVKCDGSRTRMYWDGQLDDRVAPTYIPDTNNYVMTTTTKERFSVRFFVDPGTPTWDAMGAA